MDFYNQHVHILSAFGHPVAVCCDMLGVVGSTCRNSVAKRAQHAGPNNAALRVYDKMRMIKRGWKNEDEKLRVEKCG